jgi:putative membrane protein
MIITADPWWPAVILAAALLTDAVLMIRPPKFIRECLDGVNFPREWAWTLIVIKFLGTAGLIAGIWLPGVAFATSVAVVVYFLCGVAAHFKANNARGQAFGTCLFMLALGIFTLASLFVL